MNLFILVRRMLLVFALVATTFSATAQGSSPNGLTATFFADRRLTKVLQTRIDPTIDFNWDRSAPGPGLPATNYAVRWQGYLQPPVTGTYTFVVSTDDGMRIWLDEKPILDTWKLQVPTDYRVRVPLEAGRAVALRVEYFQEEIEARARVRWLLPGTEVAASERTRPGLQAPEPQQISPRYLFQRNPDAPVAEAPPKPEPIPTPAVSVAPPAPDTLAPMPVLKSGVQFDLPNVYFETAKARLLPRSARTLDRLAEALLAQSALKIEISGHTDIIGDPDLNQRLSEARAERVLEYLTMRGVAPERLKAIGYGSTRPVARNNSPAERARNRRVEVMVR
ncbi:MAG: OmpA family protein [Hymenobacteraceae bacterium]|nr:OmpA family protein [Hymenobacteraceae bacterium]